MKRLFPVIALFLLIFSCQSGPQLDPLNDSKSMEAGNWVEVRLDSPSVKKQFKFLNDYLEERMPAVLPLELDRAFAQVVDGYNLKLICQYEKNGKKTWLKALLMIDNEGNVTGKEIVASYSIDMLEEDI